MGLTTFVAEKKANRYAEQAQELVTAYEYGNVNAAWDEVVPTHNKRDGSSDGGRGEALLFQEAIGEHGYTGRIRSTVDNGDGTATIVMTVSEKHKPRIRKADDKPTAEAAPESAAEAPKPKSVKK